MRRRTFLAALMTATAAGFGLRRPVDPQPFLDYTRKALKFRWSNQQYPGLWSTKVHYDSAILTEAMLLEARERVLNEPVRPMELVISARTARILNRRWYWR